MIIQNNINKKLKKWRKKNLLWNNNKQNKKQSHKPDNALTIAAMISTFQVTSSISKQIKTNTEYIFQSNAIPSLYSNNSRDSCEFQSDFIISGFSSSFFFIWIVPARVCTRQPQDIWIIKKIADCENVGGKKSAEH